MNIPSPLYAFLSAIIRSGKKEMHGGFIPLRPWPTRASAQAGLASLRETFLFFSVGFPIKHFFRDGVEDSLEVARLVFPVPAPVDPSE